MKLLHLFSIAGLCVLASGCSTYATSRYNVNTDNVVALRNLKETTVNVGTFTATQPGLKQIMCRGVGPIKTPDGESFSEFVRKGLVDELKIAGLYSTNSPVTLTGNLDLIDFSSASGHWNLGLTLHSSNGKSLSVVERYKFTSSFYGETACNQTAQALMPAVQNLLGKAVRSSKFVTLLRR